ncbi:MAG: HAD family hydrolase [Actinomycetota bacterium]|nr:HAD family hydrolase [Actinomycetota bacterium]
MTATEPPFDPGAIDAVALDIGGVFLLPSPGLTRDVLTEAGWTVPDDHDAYHRAHYRGVAAYRNRTWKASYLEAYADELGLPAAAAEPLERLHFSRPARELWSWRQDDAVDALCRLATTALPLAVVTNNDGTAVQQLAEGAVCQVGPGEATEVVVIVDSHIVGISKPGPAIFAPALDALGADPARVLYVGDTPAADGEGATAAGMPVVIIDPHGYAAGSGYPTVPSLGAVADLLAAG